MNLPARTHNNRVCDAPISGGDVGLLHVPVRNHPSQPLPSRDGKRDGHTTQTYNDQRSSVLPMHAQSAPHLLAAMP
ncbi:MAG: hypothetical protein LUQ65_12795 [Candidatus Helarchaeota archaeon]|nr:hypothetical protein [Candidatus Helarchaeota archaeon]